MRKSLDQCEDMGFNKVLFERDAKVVIDAIQISGENWSSYGQVIEDASPLRQDQIGISSL